MNLYFSIENYKRPSEEVDSLLNLARDKFRRLIKEADRFAKEGVRVNVIGNLSLLPSDLQSLIFQAMEVTSKNEKATLNVAFSYTSRDEMTHAVKVLANAVDTGNSTFKTNLVLSERVNCIIATNPLVRHTSSLLFFRIP